MSHKKQGRLLIVDDEAELREVLIALLEDHVEEIITAQNGDAAIALLEKQSFNAILSDEKMPKKTGLEVLRWMNEHGLKTPFILHTGYGQGDTVRLAQQLGVHGFLDKPWNENKLIELVISAVQKDLKN